MSSDEIPRRSADAIPSNTDVKRAELTTEKIDKYAAALRHYLSASLRSSTDAIDDLSQETLTRFLRPTIKPIQNEVAYLLAIARRVVLEHFHAKKRDREHGEFPRPDHDDGDGWEDPFAQVPDPTPHIEDVLHRRRTDQLMNEAVSKMDPLRRAVFIFCDRDGYSVAQTAAFCRISEAGVKRYLRDARTYVSNFISARDRDTP